MMVEEESGSPWHEILHARLEASGRADDSVIEFIEEEEVPNEGEIIDFKQDLYISADPSHHDKKRQATLLKHFSALTNVRAPARFRYLFVGFDDNGQFTGMMNRNPMGGEQAMNVDDADLRNVFADKVAPSPNFEVFELSKGGNQGGVIVIRQREQVPLVIEKTLRKNDGSAFVSEGQAYTRDGSRTIRMGSDEFAGMMRYREELITGKIQELTKGLSQVVGIPDDQLANLDLNVTESDEGIPVQELVTMDAPKSIDEELKTAVKGSKGAGGFEYQRRGLYEFLAQKDDIDFEKKGEEKIEFLVRASIRNHLHGSYWLTRYSGEMEELFETVVAEDIDGTTISPVERILLVLGKKTLLEEIDKKYGSTYYSSDASSYIGKCDRAIHIRVSEYAGESININDNSYSVSELVYGNAEENPEDLLSKVVEELLNDDNPAGRTTLRAIELICLAANA
jgi:hypothetical protein